MKLVNKQKVAVLYTLCIFCCLSLVSSQYSIQYLSPEQCKTVQASVAYFFNVTQLDCFPCTQNVTFQNTSSDGQSCVCQPGYYLTFNFGSSITCAQCPAGTTTSVDGWSCVECNTTSTISSSTCPSCLQGDISVQRQLNGNYATSSPTQTCETCANYTSPNVGSSQCVRCSQILTMYPYSYNCQCQYLYNGVCFNSPVNPVSTSVTFGFCGGTSCTVTSAYFAEYAQPAIGMCSAAYDYNVTACEQLSNMCVLILYQTTTASSGSSQQTVCDYYKAISGSSTLWPSQLPWLYYLPNTAPTVLTDTGIPTQFTFPNDQIPFLLGVSAMNGSFLRYTSVNNGLLQLCKNTEGYLNAAFTFGVTYSQSCSISIEDLWDEVKFPHELYDMWLQYTSSSGASMLYAIPVLLLNYQPSTGGFVNTGSDQSQWQLVRRFFMVDNLSGKTSLGLNSRAQYVRFAQTITLNIEMQSNAAQGGLIYPPYLTIQYNYVSSANSSTATVSFNVVYSQSYSSFQTDVSIAVGVLSGVAVLLAVLRTWSWVKRSGRVAVDLLVIIKFLVFACGYVGNAIFAVTVGASIYYEIMYKNQSTVLYIVETTNSYYVMFLAIAFSLKFVDIMHMLVVQCTADVFLIDWEKPDTRHRTPGADKAPVADAKDVSVWRTYFVANEWNELQAVRKINPVFQIIASVFFLMVIGFGNFATTDPFKNYQLNNPDQYYAPMSDMLRFSIIGMVYLLMALAQWLFFTLIYERFFDHPLHNFCDLCSVCNISVMILDSPVFGYYIHGRTVHGRADVGLRQTHINIVREEQNLCGQRGLDPGSDVQTFMVAIPKRLRAQYDQILMPVLFMQQGAASAAGVHSRGGAGMGGGDANAAIRLEPRLEAQIQAYYGLNRLMHNFLDHMLNNVDYVVRDRKLFEQILDIEFQDPIDNTGIFYKDKRLSFDSLLFYGNELSLLIFEILFFGLIDLGTQNYLFDGAMLYLLMEVFVKPLRHGFGRWNLAKKTLVDKRFLI